MHFTETGSGTPLVLLPPFPFDSRAWDRVRLGLAEHARVITPDPRGFGRTPLDGAEPDLSVIAADVLALLDRLELDRAVLGGCSMGGYEAMAVLRAAPERVGGLVLIDTKHTADAQEAKENRYATAERAEREGVAWLPDAMVGVLLGATTLARRPDVVDTVRRALAQAEPGSVAWGQRAMAARPDSGAVLRAADVPALVLTGEEDSLIPVDAARAMTELLPRAELVVLPEAGHLPSFEVPAELTAAVAGWLRQHGEPG
jgi:pimeloyl-ACP methyl ester carboxylesterase